MIDLLTNEPMRFRVAPDNFITLTVPRVQPKDVLRPFESHGVNAWIDGEPFPTSTVYFGRKGVAIAIQAILDRANLPLGDLA